MILYKKYNLESTSIYLNNKSNSRINNIGRDFTKKNLKINIDLANKARSKSGSKDKESLGRDKNIRILSYRENQPIGKKLQQILDQKRKPNQNKNALDCYKQEKHMKKEALDFYLNLLRRVELLKFTVNYSDLNEKKLDSKSNSYVIEVENVKIDNNDENLCYESISSKYGKDYFSNIFIIY